VTNTVRFALDDQIDIQTTTNTGTSNAGPLTIGAHFNGSGNIDSEISELQALSAVASAVPFRITASQFSASGDFVNLTFESDDTRLYAIQRSTTLQANDWVDVQTQIPGATGQIETTIFNIPVDSSAEKEFFRVLTNSGL